MTELEEKTMKKQQFILGWLCVVLPFVSIGFGLIGAFTKCNPPTWWYSISATFFANSNIILIGLLFTTGIYFWAYKGYDKADNIVTKLCAVFSFMIITFPALLDSCKNESQLVGLFCLPNNTSHTIHCISALSLYGCFLVMMLRFRKSSGKMTDKKRYRNHLYLTFAIIMGSSGVLIFLKSVFKWPGYTTLILETIAQLCFGLSWLIKAGKFKFLND
jgi:hypothetical protein